MRRAALAALTFLLVTAARAVAPATYLRNGPTEYVNLIDVCGRLGLRFVFSRDGRTMTVQGGVHVAEFFPYSESKREVIFDGVRLYLGDLEIQRGGRIYVSRTDYEHRLIGLFRPDLLNPPLRRPHVIILDPGHGGPDPGTQNFRRHLQEKTLTLDVALRLKPILEAQGWTVIMTRTRDIQLVPDKIKDLEMRARLAGQYRADVFLSIHFDAGPNESTHGSMILSYNPAGQRSSKSWGGRSDAQGRPMPGNRWDGWNAVLANCVFHHLPHWLGTSDSGERIQDISVLRNNADCPAVLVEPAYLSNDAEAQRLQNPAFREQIAETLAAGLKDYAQTIALLPTRTVR
ncbi:MAG TPA: N-acetylmuramoyl-L-alanine amidase [Opitutaceae bacterium]|jgi:N-acetylmuramoyl-L-alanine amidase